MGLHFWLARMYTSARMSFVSSYGYETAVFRLQQARAIKQGHQQVRGRPPWLGLDGAGLGFAVLCSIAAKKKPYDGHRIPHNFESTV